MASKKQSKSRHAATKQLGDPADIEAQIIRLRDLTASMHVIHEAQHLQLRYWGAVTFGAKSGWSAHVSIDDREVEYRVPRMKRYPPQFAALIAALDRSIHWLLGEDWRLRVVEGRTTIYEGSKTPRMKKSHEPRPTKSADAAVK